MREWYRRADFKTALPTLLQGEDVDFANYIRRVEVEESRANE